MIRSSPLQLSTLWLRGFAIWLLAATALGPNLEVSAASVEVWYGPEDRPLEHLVRMYDRAQRYIFIAVYGLTSPLTVKALVEAKRRGVDVRVVTDRERLEDVKQQTALSTLREAGIPIKINRHDGLMHLKQAVIDDEINTNGSMNQTTSGNRYNDERLDIIRDHALAVKAREKFLSLWKDTSDSRSGKSRNVEGKVATHVHGRGTLKNNGRRNRHCRRGSRWRRGRVGPGTGPEGD